MDQILKGVVASGHPENVKKSLIQQLVAKASNSIPEEQCKSIFESGSEWMMNGGTAFVRNMGELVLISWAKHHKAVFQKFFTEDYLLSILADSGNMSKNVVYYIRTSFNLLQHTPQIFSLYTIVRHRAHSWVNENQIIDFCAAVGSLLKDYHHCWPVGEHLLELNLSLIHCLSKTELPNTSKEELKGCIENAVIIGDSLNAMWTKNQSLIYPVLTEIYLIISAIGRHPSVALASVVHYFPPEVIDNATRLVASNAVLPNESFKLALTRMIKWLSWPKGKRVDQWIIGFLRALAIAQKHSILITVTLETVGQVRHSVGNSGNLKRKFQYRRTSPPTSDII